MHLDNLLSGAFGAVLALGLQELMNYTRARRKAAEGKRERAWLETFTEMESNQVVTVDGLDAEDRDCLFHLVRQGHLVYDPGFKAFRMRDAIAAASWS
jgi:hypothetical protein